MARGSSPHKEEEIPKVSFRIVDAQEDALATGLTLKVKMDASTATYRHYGFNPLGQDFVRDEHYIRYIEPIEAELAHQVEYDMDEQDREWLDAVNEDRKAHQLDRVSYELFEVIMDKLEKEWFNLAKRIPSAAGDVPTEDSKCAICDDAEGENSNAIVFCDGCNLAVHQDCYGVPYIPEGQWLCRKCTVEPENPVDCIFCPAEAGAFKQTTEAQWAHLLCAIWIPEVGVSNPVYMEPIEGVDGIPKSRWKLLCSICRVKMGACVQCDNKNCFVAFHVTCARSQGLLGTMKGANHDGTLRAHCFRHLSAERQTELIEEGVASEEMLYAETPTRASPAVDRKRNRKAAHAIASGLDAVPKSNGIVKQAKAARAHAKSYHDGPLLVPAIMVKAILDYTTKGKVRKPKELIERVCRYWSLKREARRGAPLLKRLYLEPWTASNASKEQTDAEKAKKLEYLMLVRNDLERVRMLAELVKKRESEKFRQAQIIKAFVDDFMFPHDAKLRSAFDKITALDRQNLFLEPVSRQEVPDYYTVIRRPMSWSVISEKLTTHRYAELVEFQADIDLALDNAMTYNPPDNPYHKLAARIKKVAGETIHDLKASLAAEGGPSSLATSDLEASDGLIIALLGGDQHDGPIDRDPVTTLFSFEFERLLQRELPPPPPPPRKTKAELRAVRDAQLAQRIAQGLVSVRATRAAGPIEEEPPLAAPVTPRTIRIPARRERKRAGIAVPSPTPSSRSDTVMPLSRPQTGVAGLASYSPLDLQERLKRERQLGLIVDKVDDKDHFKRFNVGWVLPEGMKRGGRPARNETPPIETKPVSRKSKGKSVQETGRPAAIDAGSAPGATVPKISDDATTTPETPSRLAFTYTPSTGSTLSSLTESESGTPTRPAVTYGANALAIADTVSITSSAKEAEAAADAAEIHQLRTRGHVVTVHYPTIESAQAGPSRITVDSTNSDSAVVLDGSKVASASSASAVPDGKDDARKSARSRQKRKLSDEHWETISPRKKQKVIQYGSSNKKRSVDVSSEMAATPRRAKAGGRRAGSSALSEQSVVRVSSGRSRKKVDPSKSGETATLAKGNRTSQTDPEIAGSETSDLSEGEADEVYETRIKELGGANGAGGPEADMDDPYPEGTLVWAKVGGYPFFPAAIVDVPEEYDNISDLVWSQKPVQKPGHEEKVWLVRFYDKSRSFGWCGPGRIDPLGEKDETDAMYLVGRDKKSHKSCFKGHSVAKSVREAYEAAKAEIAIEGDEGYEP